MQAVKGFIPQRKYPCSDREWFRSPTKSLASGKISLFRITDLVLGTHVANSCCPTGGGTSVHGCVTVGDHICAEESGAKDDSNIGHGHRVLSLLFDNPGRQ